LGAPGPTAITVASGRGFDVAEDGRKIPEDVFCQSFSSSSSSPPATSSITNVQYVVKECEK
jgi:hypothetical protein